MISSQVRSRSVSVAGSESPRGTKMSPHRNCVKSVVRGTYRVVQDLKSYFGSRAFENHCCMPDLRRCLTSLSLRCGGSGRANLGALSRGRVVAKKNRQDTPFRRVGWAPKGWCMHCFLHPNCVFRASLKMPSHRSRTLLSGC